MLEIKPDELMVGSGDGSVCLIRDTTLIPKNGKGRSKSMNSGVSTTVKEPTEPCLTEVSYHIDSNRLNVNGIPLIESVYSHFYFIISISLLLGKIEPVYGSRDFFSET